MSGAAFATPAAIYTDPTPDPKFPARTAVLHIPTHGVSINGLALLTFVLSDTINWKYGLTMAAGGILGGYSTAAFARRIESRYVRRFVIVVGWSMTVYFFLPHGALALWVRTLLAWFA